jgi:hypothetical protein
MNPHMTLPEVDCCMTSSIGIYQPFYKSGLRERLDPGFIPLDWMANPAPRLRELALHHHIASEALYRKHQLTGVLSPKFYSKTGLSSEAVYKWITLNQGYDIYLINGAPFVPYANYNTIERNEKQAPAFEERMRFLCSRIGFNLPEIFPRQTNANLCSCNYWIMSPPLWRNWSKDVIDPLLRIVQQNDRAHGLLEDGNYPAPVPVYKLTLIYERLMDHYIAQNKLNAIYYPWAAEDVLALQYHPTIDEYLNSMVPRVDRIDARGNWSEEERSWLRESYAAVSLGFAIGETLSADPLDHDLPRRYPNKTR